jgi:CO/xanthine dehydrogenase FAD-binding subunit
MDVVIAGSLEEALTARRDAPGVVPIAGGTDLMVELNFDRHRPEAILDICRVPELHGWRRDDGSVFLGAGVTYTEIMRDLADQTVLAQASRTVGSPQIRNRATVGGNLGTASPAGDALPPLAVYDAEIELVKAGGGSRRVPFGEFITGVKRNALEPDELILGAHWKPVRGPGSFSKIGTRNAMVISVVSLAFQLDEDGRSVRVALGSVAPGIVRATEAETFGAGALTDAGLWNDPYAAIGDGVGRRFGELTAAAASPIDDVRGTAAYRRHAVAVLAQRALGWALEARRGDGRGQPPAPHHRVTREG